ncbi:unnamed protein product [Aphis gossypii]|uniref:Uncharacterized protein n=1 Tax=Aphis gossypii TaxID=80765 RepID=A0A9P0JF46_APHGO|nr:unnamed protein product [Aphis gossypii]
MISHKERVRGTRRDLRKLLFLPRSSKTTKTRNKRKRVNRQSRCTCTRRGGDKHYCYNSSSGTRRGKRRRASACKKSVRVSTGPYRRRGFGERARSVNSVVGFNLHESISSNRVRCATTAALILSPSWSGRKSRKLDASEY